MLIEFERAARPATQVVTPESGEDEGYGEVTVQEAPAPRMLTVNPAFISMFFESQTPGISVIKGPDGRGFLVVGSYLDIKSKLEAAGWQRPDDEEAAIN